MSQPVLASEQHTITSEPVANDMHLNPNAIKERGNNSSDDDRSSLSDFSQAPSGYERETNECTEFCMECVTCFGMFSTCCPSSGEGCLTSTAVFCGNILFGCCKC